MRILVTGTNGFIGSKLAARLIKNGADSILGVNRGIGKHDWVGNYQADLTNQWEVEKLFSYCRPDIIFHLAGNPLPKLCPLHPSKIWSDNVVATQNLLDFCPQGCNFIYASSVVVYGDQPYSLDETSLTIPTSVYGLTKLAGEELVRIYSEQGKVVGKIARLCATVGVGTHHGIVPDLIKKCKESVEKGIELEVIGACPGSEKPFLHIDNVVDALVKMAAFPRYSTFNVSSNDSINCENIAEIIIDYFGRKLYGDEEVRQKIKWLGEAANWKGDNRKLIVDNTWLEENTGWRGTTAKEAIELAVKDYYEYYRPN